MRKIEEEIAVLSKKREPILISGAQGTGKVFIAAKIHEAGSNASGPFIVIDCRNLAEGEVREFLFGSSLFLENEEHTCGFESLRHVGAIERFYPDRLTEHVERLAHHAMRGEMWEQAVTYLRQAGAKALARSANREAASCFEQALSAMETMGYGVHQARFLVYLGEAYVLADRFEDALQLAGRALTLARERGQRPYEARALRLLGEVNARREPPEQADGHYRDALALAEELGMRPLVAHCQLGLGKLYHRTGKRQEAREHLVTATTMYREMDMRFWLEQAEAEIRGLA